MRTGMKSLGVVLCLLLFFSACSKKSEQPAAESQGGTPTATPTDNNPPAAGQNAGESKAPVARAEKAKPVEAEPVVIPSGTVITVRLSQAVGSKISNSGDTFTGTVADAIESNGKTVIPAGAPAEGTVTEAVPLGRFKGGARLRLNLSSVTVDGKPHQVQTSALSFQQTGKGKRTAGMIGGGAGLGAIIGGIAGGGKGAAIGALAGAGAGTAGTAFTGNKDIALPAESAVRFKLEQPLQVTR